MKTKYLFIFFVMFLIAEMSSAQVKLLSVNQLENRISQGKNTVYMVNF